MTDSKDRITRRVGIMGGTFDPIHIGHLILGEKAYEQFKLEKVMFMPSGNPPHKQNRSGCASDEQRVAMVGKAIKDNPHFEISLIEMNEQGYTYTYRTLELLRSIHPETEYYFIIGGDSLFTFDTWMEPQRICNNCTLLVAVRNHTPIPKLEEQMKILTEKFHGRFLLLHTENIDISSHQLREWVGEGKSTKYYLTDPVIDYIEENKIYGKI